MLERIFQGRKNGHTRLIRIFVLCDRIDYFRDSWMLVFDVSVRVSDSFHTTNGPEIIAMGNIVFLSDGNTVRFHSYSAVHAILLIFLFPFQTQRFLIHCLSSKNWIRTKTWKRNAIISVHVLLLHFYSWHVDINPRLVHSANTRSTFRLWRSFLTLPFPSDTSSETSNWDCSSW